ncbi:MAG: tetratricopeptide repeat protein [Deltaproteobacteria bacterium]|nr:tetratricopeptide repeat protein [Deltaproteobacteria bacterium]
MTEVHKREDLPDRETLKDQYVVVKPQLEKQLQSIHLRLRCLLEKQGNTPTIKYRVKEFSNYYSKLAGLYRKQPEEDNLLGDLLGLRVICPFLEDLDIVERLITADFDVVELEHKADRHSFREFGYDSVHLLVKLEKSALGNLPQTAPVCEIQLRTILQDAWAEVEHELVYKSDLGFPNDSIKRKLASLNASLTLSDLIFQEIRDYQKELRQRGIKRRQSVEDVLTAAWPIEIANLPQSQCAEELEAVVEGEPQESPRGLEKSMFKALEAHSNKDFPVAIQLYSRILRMKLDPPIRSLVYNHRGMALFALADCQKAIDDFSKAIQHNTTNGRAWCNRGLAHRVLGDYDRSLEDYEQAIQLATAPFEGFWGHAQTCFEMQLYSRALSDCEKVIGLQSDFKPALELMKTIRRQMF